MNMNHRDRLMVLETIADIRTAAWDRRVLDASRKLDEAQEIALADVRSNTAPADAVVGPTRWRVVGCRWLARRLLRLVYRLLDVA